MSRQPPPEHSDSANTGDTGNRFRVVVIYSTGEPVIVDSGISRERAERIRSAQSDTFRDVTIEEIVSQPIIVFPGRLPPFCIAAIRSVPVCYISGNRELSRLF